MGYVAVGTAWGFARQTGFGHRPTVSKWIPFISETVSQNYDQFEITDSESRFKRDDQPQGRKRVEGDIDTYVESVNVGYPLYFLMGSVAESTGAAAGTHVYTFDVADSLDYFTSEFKYGTLTGKGKRSFDNMMRGATFDFADDMFTVTWNVHGADYSGNISPSAITQPTGRKFNMKDASITITPDGGSASGVKIKSGSLEVENGLITDDFYQGSQTVQQLDAGVFAVRGNLELIMDKGTGLNSWLEGTKKAKVQVKYEGDTIAGSVPHTIEFIVPNAWCGTHDVNMTQNEVIVRNVEFEGFYNANTSPKVFQVKLTNDVSGAGYGS